ncbi:Uncharacterised protein [Mycobacteroides abscessus subsp. abscessus]|nr:Uncharacterised protein [Mycobacteroides abscessus subsp. abscessus]
MTALVRARIMSPGVAKAEKVVTKLPGAPFCQYTLNR